jgi:apolipoprotein N-acyltransferase
MQKSKADVLATWYNGAFFPMFFGCVFYLLALPPTEMWWFGWLVAAFWTPLIRRKCLLQKQMPIAEEKDKEKRPKNQKKRFLLTFLTKNRFKNHPYRQIWLAGVIFWGFAVHWVCFPHPAACFGWFALICYLGLYFPLFAFFARILHFTTVCGHKIPVWLAAPVAWLAISYLKSTLMGGFGFALLEHTQYKQTALIQFADIGGESLVGAVMIFVGVLLGYCLPITISPKENRDKNTSQTETCLGTSRLGLCFCLGMVVVSFVLIISYGKFRDSQYVQPEQALLKVALLQGNYRASLSAPPGWYDKVFENYRKMAVEASEQHGDEIDLIVWPESTCIIPWVDVDRTELSLETQGAYSEEQWDELLTDNNREICDLVQDIGKPCLLGLPSYVFSEKKNGKFCYNSALMIDNVYVVDYDSGKGNKFQLRHQRYDKMLLVMFGEYIPLTDFLPEGFFLKTLCQRADFGRQPVSFDIIQGDVKEKNHVSSSICHVSANICFESSSSKLIRSQVRALANQGTAPDVLVNISNDGWFRHSSQIDMHLATHVFRAIENRKPYLVATNGGFSAGIDGSGRILSIGKRNSNQVVLVKLFADSRSAWYLGIGAFFPLISLLFVVVMSLFRIGKKCVTVCHATRCESNNTETPY